MLKSDLFNTEMNLMRIFAGKTNNEDKKKCTDRFSLDLDHSGFGLFDHRYAAGFHFCGRISGRVFVLVIRAAQTGLEYIEVAVYCDDAAVLGSQS